MNIFRFVAFSFICFCIAASNATAEGFTAFGDSHTVGVGASTPAKSWLGLMSPVNIAASGAQAAEVSNAVQAITPAPRTRTIMVGTNDHRTYKADAAKQEFFKRFLRQSIAWLTYPDKCKGRDACMSYTGTWSNTAANTFGKVSTQNGATAQTTVTGQSVYLCYIIQNHSSAQSSAAVEVDGVSVGTVGSYGAMNTVNGSTFASACARFGGLSSGSHTVKVTVTSSGKNFYLDYISGSDQPTGHILVSNIVRMTATAYSTYGTSVANITAYNGIVSDVVSEFAGDGADVTLIDNYSSVTPADLAADGVHLNDSGHAKVSANFAAAM